MGFEELQHTNCVLAHSLFQSHLKFKQLQSYTYVKLKTKESFELIGFIKGRVSLAISGSQTYNELCPIHEISSVFQEGHEI